MSTENENTRLYISNDTAFITSNPGDIKWIDQKIASEFRYSSIEGCIRQSSELPIKQSEAKQNDHS